MSAVSVRMAANIAKHSGIGAILVSLIYFGMQLFVDHCMF